MNKSLLADIIWPGGPIQGGFYGAAAGKKIFEGSQSDTRFLTSGFLYESFFP